MEAILIIEDDSEIADLLEMHIQDLGYRVECRNRGDTGLERALSGEFSLIVLDIMLPVIDGLEICRRIRQQNRNQLILMLTAKAEEIDKVLGLELGADDYLAKPFSIRELLARIRAILRRQEKYLSNDSADKNNDVLRFGDLTIHCEKRQVRLGGNPVSLTTKEFDLLAFLANHPGKPFSREVLLNSVWGYNFTGYEHTVNSHINRLRTKIEPDPGNPQFVKTVWGVGYRFADTHEIKG